jgi:alkylation response protein AidB-like acyl-CoA dehydrogenase
LRHGSVRNFPACDWTACRWAVGQPDSSRETDPVMEFAFSESERHWYEAAVKFAREELSDPDSVERERGGEFWREGYRRCARFGIQGLPVPVDYGGRGQDLVTTAAAIEGLGYGCGDTGLVFATGASLWTTTMAIVGFGTPAQKQRYLPGLCDGSLLGANAASEAAAGSDIFAMQARAEKHPDGWILNGRKTWITSAPVADLFVCLASTDPSKGVLGITAFLVERDTAGFRVGREIPTLGLRTAPMGELIFENCVIPPDAILGREGRGPTVFNAALEWERGAILAGVLGTMRRQLERCITQAKARKQFGQSIGKFQTVSNRIVEMKLRLETSRFMVYRYAWATSHGDDAAAWASMAKLHVSECFVQNSLDAVRLFGASGYASGTGLERDLRDSVGGLIFSGTNDIQRNLIAGYLRLT